MSSIHSIQRVRAATNAIPIFVAATFLVLAAAPARAQFPGDVPDTFRLDVGGMYAWFTTNVNFQENLTPGGPIGGGIDLQPVTGLPSSTGGFTARGYWQPLKRFYIDFGYTEFTRSSTRAISVDIPFGDSTFTAGASVATSVKSELPYIDLRYNFIQNDSWHLGVSLGGAYSILKAGLTASAGVIGPNGPIVGQSTTREAKLEVPVPLLGIDAEFKFGDRVSGGVLFNGIFAPVHPYSGSVFVVEPHVDWFISKNFGVGGAFNYSTFHIKKDDLPATLIDFRYSYYGPKVYAILTF
ncbi:MAG TPA: hypothetical protein VKG23_00165 [Thermoanaerobaculia bacterium]|nr:hypothetical protein [Thermoanaerobaculia bacterium]